MPCQREMEQEMSLSHWQIGQASHTGCARERNEDASLALQFLLVQQDESPFPLGLFALADGAGGHLQGQQASALACRLAAAYLLRQILLPFLDGTHEHGERAPINDVLESSVSIAHDTIAHQLPEAGTTLTLALALDNGVRRKSRTHSATFYTGPWAGGRRSSRTFCIMDWNRKTISCCAVMGCGVRCPTRR